MYLPLFSGLWQNGKKGEIHSSNIHYTFGTFVSHVMFCVLSSYSWRITYLPHFPRAVQLNTELNADGPCSKRGRYITYLPLFAL